MRRQTLPPLPPGTLSAGNVTPDVILLRSDYPGIFPSFRKTQDISRPLNESMKQTDVIDAATKHNGLETIGANVEKLLKVRRRTV